MELLRLWSHSKELQCDFLITGGEPAEFDREAVELGAKIFYLPFNRRNLGAFSRRFKGYLREGRYDAIHDHQDRASGWHFLLGTPYLPPVRVTHIHNPSYQILNNYGTNALRRMTAAFGMRLIKKFTTHIAATSYQVIREYGFENRKFCNIPKAALHCAFHTKRFLGDSQQAKHELCRELNLPAKTPIVLFAGRMDHSAERVHPQNHKNSAFAVDVALECFRENNAHILFAGLVTEALPILKQRTAHAGLEDRFHFLGIRKDIERLMLGSDVLYFPSRGEGLGMVAVEAQAAGLRVLASSAVPRECVVIPELVRFEDLNAPVTQWAAVLRTLLSQPRSDCTVTNAQVAASAFSIDNCNLRLQRLYRDGILT